MVWIPVTTGAKNLLHIHASVINLTIYRVESSSLVHKVGFSYLEEVFTRALVVTAQHFYVDIKQRISYIFIL